MIIPIDHSYDFHHGYLSGQRAAQSSRYLNKTAQRNVGAMRMEEQHPCNKHEFMAGFMHGYSDELAGLAQPLERGADNEQDSY